MRYRGVAGSLTPAARGVRISTSQLNSPSATRLRSERTLASSHPFRPLKFYRSVIPAHAKPLRNR
jgi:hypothetical protein